MSIKKTIAMTFLPNRLDYIPYHCFDSAENMAIDEQLFESIKTKQRNGILRLYGWNSPAITIGYFQKGKTIDLERCKQYNIPVIRRLTGGRGVFHHHDLTFSFFLQDNGNGATHKKNIFSLLSHIILAGLQNVNIKASLSFKKSGEHRHPNCFKATSLWEITTLNGKKLVGSAMLIKDGGIMMQGSIPVDHTDSAISYFICDEEDQIKKSIRSNKKWSKGFIEKFVKGITEKIELKKSKLTVDEKIKIKTLTHEKYLTHQWNQLR